MPAKRADQTIASRDGAVDHATVTLTLDDLGALAQLAAAAHHRRHPTP
jgi:hypothetical protein